MNRNSSGKKVLKKTKQSSSGARTSKPAIFLLIVVGIFGVLYNPSNSIEETLHWEISEAGILSFPEREEAVFTVQIIENLYSPENPDTLRLFLLRAEAIKFRLC